MKSKASQTMWKALASMRFRANKIAYMNGIAGILLFSLMIIMTPACSDHARPDSLEPIIVLSEASDISRTEATLEAYINRRGPATLSYVTLTYHETGTTSEMNVDGDPNSDRFLFHLSGLRPGASYSCQLEAGTGTATLKSATLTFTTIPNELPTVSSPVALSTGPLGIIVQFSVIDDGGEDISEAGCEIRTLGVSESRRVYVDSSPDDYREWRLGITGLTPQTTYIITPFASNSLGEAHGGSLEYTTKNSILLQQPGELANLFGNDPELDLKSITISGLMNGDDFRTLRTFLGAPADHHSKISLSEIDLTDVSIVEGGGSYDGQRFTAADHLTSGLFAGCTHLRSALLPNSATVMERNSFAGCQALEVLTVPANVEALLPSTDCPALKAIKVSEANKRFSSIDGVLFNQNATEILWFPTGKTGDYTLPPSITAIGENAFAGTSITGLVVPSTVTVISRGAFAGSSLTEIFLPDNITNISEGMFQNCIDLAAVHLGSGTEYVGNFAFDGTSIRDIYLAAEIPPFTMEDTFLNGDSTVFGQCTLHVPSGCRKLYANHRQWGSFSHIEEFQP